MLSQSTATSRDSTGKIPSERKGYWLAALERRASCLPHALFLMDAASARGGLLAWEEEIAVLRGVIAFAQTQRNAFAPGCLPPPEILSHIFTYVKIHCTKPASPSRTPSQHGRKGIFGWLVITQVCKNWRSVAIGHSALWAEISNMSNRKQPWDTFLQRASSYPLSIVAKIPKSPQGSNNALSTADAKLIRLINKHIHHTRDLRLHLTTHASEALTSLLSNTAPKPGMLVLHLDQVLYRAPIVLPPIVLPLSFLKSASALQEIRLDGYVFPWDAVLPNLQILVITHGPLRWILSPSDVSHCDTDSILQCLRHMPKLEELSLSYLPIATRVSSGIEAVVLPRLKKISLIGAPQACLDLWRPIRAHPHANISVLAWVVPDMMQDLQIEEAQIQDAISILSLHLTSPDSLTFKRASIYCYGNLISKLVMETDLPPDLDDTRDEGQQQTRIEFRLDLDFKQSSQSIFVSFCAKIPLHHIEELSVHESDALSVEEWTLLLSAARSLETINLIDMFDGPVRTFCSAMTPASIPPQERTSCCQQKAWEHQVLVPRLAQLELCEIDFGATSSDSNVETVASCLMRMLKARKAAQCPLQALTIDSCYSVRELEVKELKQFVPKVEWDDDPASDNDDFDEEYSGLQKPPV